MHRHARHATPTPLRRLPLALAGVAAVAAACSPAWNWRELRADGTAVSLQLPCRPDRHERRATLDGQTLPVTLLSCEAGGVQWGLAWFDGADPARTGALLLALRGAAAARVGGGCRVDQTAPVPGATPRPEAASLACEGTRADGRALALRTVLFAHGTRVYQATAAGERLPADAVATFAAGLRVNAP